MVKMTPCIKSIPTNQLSLSIPTWLLLRSSSSINPSNISHNSNKMRCPKEATTLELRISTSRNQLASMFQTRRIFLLTFSIDGTLSILLIEKAEKGR